MDRIGPRLAVLKLCLKLGLKFGLKRSLTLGLKLGLTLGLCAALVAAAQSAPYPIRAAQWLDPPQRVMALSGQPAECAAVPRDAGERQLFEIGRAAFRAPLLLGGQAARSGLSCASCHSNGRRNSAFRFPGLSGEPGTADVTSSLMSSHRGNGQFDPRPIPDLAAPVKVARARGDPALETFIHGLITQEFDGAEPPRLILQGLGAYVRSIGRPGCDLKGREQVRLVTLTGDTARAVAASSHAGGSGDAPAARLLLSSARSALGLIYERYAAPRLASDRLTLLRADLDLQAIEQAMDRKDPHVPGMLAAWQADMPRWTAPLARDEAKSLFAAANLSRSLTAISRPLPAHDGGSPHR